MKPIFLEVCIKHPALCFGHVYCEQCPELTEQYDIGFTPTYGIFINGELVERQVGEMSKDALTRFLQSGLSKRGIATDR